MPNTTDNARLAEELRKTHDRLLCNVADNGARVKNETDYQADAEVALDVCWRAATALASANALNERLVAFVQKVGKDENRAASTLRYEARALLADMAKGGENG